MFLIGQYDSPFVRRTAIALRLYGLPFEHKPWSTFGDAEQVAAYNPVQRVPTLVLDDGEALIESSAILDYLDELVGPDKAMIARSGIERRRHLRIMALATGLADKAVSLVYERVLRKACGRADDVIISAGWTMSAVEIENTMLRHENVLECGVIGVPGVVGLSGSLGSTGI